MNISIEVLPLAEEKKVKLKERGYLFINSLRDFDTRKLFGSLGSEDISECLQKPIVQSALQIWKAEVSRPRIVTFSSQLDGLLGGGVELQTITDLCGAPGTGKTQICLQLCLAVQLPEIFGGVGGTSLYVDTSNGASISRLQDIAEACVQHCQWVQQERGNNDNIPDVSQLMAGVRVLRTPGGTLEELLSSLIILNEQLKSMPQVRLVVIDSFSKPFLLYCDNEVLTKRTALIYDVLTRFQNIATKYNVAIVTTSQLTTMLGSEGDFVVVPGLGQGFAHRVTHRVMLGLVQHGDTMRRAAHLIKSPSNPRQSVFFQITKSGIRDEGCSP